MQALLDLPNPSNDMIELRRFYDTVENHIRGLSSLGKSQESYGSLLIPIILGKLPIELRHNLAWEHSNLEWTIDELRGAILKEIQILEQGLFITSTALPSNTQGSVMTTASLHAGTRTTHFKNQQGTPNKKPVCVYCKGGHTPNHCDVITNSQKRLEVVKKERLCFNCLAHHKVSEYRSKHRCNKCK